MEGDEPRAAAGHDAYGVGRPLAFSDGVFAIAITLLVLTIPVPDVDDDNQRLLAALGRLEQYLAGFALSFALVGAHWMSER